MPLSGCLVPVTRPSSLLAIFFLILIGFPYGADLYSGLVSVSGCIRKPGLPRVYSQSIKMCSKLDA